jgi:hypothetical protein
MVSSVWADGPEIPEDSRITGEFEKSATALMALSGTGRIAARIQGPIDQPNDALWVRGKTGPKMMGLTLTLKDAAGQATSLSIRPILDKPNHPLPDSYLALGWKKGWGKYYFKPNAAFYKADELAKRKAAWEKLPGASQSVFDVELRPVAGSDLEVWFNGQFMQKLALPGPSVSFEVSLAPEAAVEAIRLIERQNFPSLALPVSREAGPEDPSGLTLEFQKGAEIPAAFQGLAGSDATGLAVGGLGTFTGLASDDLQSFFWRRHVSHRLPEQRMFSVPLAVYSHANVLCAVDPKPGTVPEFTLRVTRYGGSRGNALADSIVRLPQGDAANTPDVRRVGAVRMQDGEETSLWLIKVPIKNGLIEDLLHFDQLKDANVGTPAYLDVELLDPLPNVDKADAFPPTLELTNRAWRPVDQNPKSGVLIFGVELVRSPADLTVRANTGFQAFYASDRPEFIANVQALKSGDYAVSWAMADLSGNIVATGTQAFSLEASKEHTVTIPVSVPVGWYAAQFELTERGTLPLIDYRTSFVMLPPDTRKAGLESPFFGWWFQKNQRSDVKLNEVGPLLQRLGIRRVTLPEDMPERETLKYGFTRSTISWKDGRLAMLDYRDGKKTLAEALEAQEKSIRATLALWPSIDRMLVFHESGAKGAPFPSELWGEPAKNNLAMHDENSPEALLAKEGGGVHVEPQKKTADEWQQNWPSRLEYLQGMGRMVREKFPQLKMQFGNDGNSLGLMGELFRQKFPREFMDTISIEDLGQTIAPERALIGGFQSAWFLRETARQMGYGDVPITACTEWIGRMTDRLGLQKQAEWKVRDGLLALAYGFDTISIAGINDATSGYYYSIWANGGLCFRYPIMAPKPAYAAVATLTQVLDQAKFERFVPTGSTTLYVMEFRRGEEWVYAVWTPRGRREVTLDFGNEEPRIQTDLYGRTVERQEKAPVLEASPAVTYVSSKNRLASVTAGRAAYPDDSAPANPLQTISLDSLSEVRVLENPRPQEYSRSRPEVIPQLRQGEFDVREVEDPKMGRCLEIELKPTKNLQWPMQHEYVTLYLKTPVSTRATQAGVWIKGNGSWGEVDVLKTSNGPWMSNNSDLALRWPGDATLNFDGWNFIRYPANGKAKETTIQGLQISLPRQTLYGTEMTPVENLKIRVKSILLF